MVKSRTAPAKPQPLDLVDFDVIELVYTSASRASILNALDLTPDEFAMSIERVSAYYASQAQSLNRRIDPDASLQEIQVHARQSVDRIRECLARLV